MKKKKFLLIASIALLISMTVGLIPTGIFSVKASESATSSDGRGNGAFADNDCTDRYDFYSGGILSKTGSYTATVPSDRREGDFYVFETDFKWTSSTGSPQYNPNWRFSFLLEDTSGSCLTTQSGQLWLLVNGDTGCFTTGGGTAADWIDSDGDGISDNSIFTLMKDEWCNVRYEVYYITNGNGTYKREVSAYVNGSVVNKTVEVTSTTKPTYGKAVISVRGGTAGSFALDNTYYGAVSRSEDELRELQWQNLASVVGGGERGEAIVEAMKAHYAIYSPEVFDWLADLYDREVGGFYYSNAARDNDTVVHNGVTYDLLPDVESTAQALEFLSNSGALNYYYGGNYAKATPEWMKEDIIAFVKGLQDPDGYFYHPQWKGKLTYQHRLSRDAVWCRNLLKAYGYSPYYDTGDMTGEGAPVSALSTRLSGSNSILAVSKVMPAAQSYPAHLESVATLKNYLNNMDFAYNSYGNGNTLVTQLADITARDAALGLTGSSNSLLNTIVDHLNERIIPEKGHWDVRDAGDEGYSDYYGVNGLLKIISIYTTAGRAHPYPEAAFRSAMKSINSTEEVGAVVDIYNAYWLIQLLRSNVMQYGTAAQKATIQELQESLILANAPELIRNATRKIADFEKEGGSFSYARSYSSHLSQDMPVTIPNTPEGDVNATGIAIGGLTGYLYAALGVADEHKVPIFTSREADRFFKRIAANGAFTPEPSLGEGSYVSADLTLDFSGEENGYKTVSGSSTQSFDVPEYYSSGNTYIFETDIRFSPISVPTSGYDTNWPMYIYLSDENGSVSSDYSRLYAMTSGEYVCLSLASGATWSDSDGDGVDDDSLAVLDSDEWYNIRYEIKQELNSDNTTYTRTVTLYVNNTLLKTVVDSTAAEYKDFTRANITTRYSVTYDLDNTYVGSVYYDGRGTGSYFADPRTEKYDTATAGHISPNASHSVSLNSSAAHDLYVFETDIRINSASTAGSNPNWVFYITLHHGDSSALATTESGRLCVLIKDGAACITKGGYDWIDANADGKSDNSICDIELGKWYNIRYEVKQEYNSNGLYTRGVYIYVNGVSVNSYIFETDRQPEKYNVNRVNLTCRASVQYDLDNTFFGGFTNEAEVGGVGYTSLGEAIDAAPSGSTVKLLTDVTLLDSPTVSSGREITLDLAGRKIVGEEIGIVNSGTLTVTDTVGGGEYLAKEILNSEGATARLLAGKYGYKPDYSLVPEGYVLAKSSADGGFSVFENTWFEFLGGSLRYADSEPDGSKASMRMGYDFSDGFVFEGSDWRWSYELGTNGAKTLYGEKYNANTNESNIVFTDIEAANYGKDITVRLSFEITVGGVEYTVTDRARVRSVIGVTEALIVRGAEGEVLDYLNTVKASYESAVAN
ncbi:MAG: hypothetical protein J6C09_08465 [Clostridia bacterium]|nr:hypothetical protein [Clostridia bacterium]